MRKIIDKIMPEHFSALKLCCHFIEAFRQADHAGQTAERPAETEPCGIVAGGKPVYLLYKHFKRSECYPVDDR